MSEPPIASGIDHPVIAVRDMAAGRAAYKRLGFTVTPRGRHREWGTGNWCIMFEKNYLELRGIIDPAAQNPAHRLPARDGLMGIAFATHDAEATYVALSHSGFRPQPVKRLTRDFELPEGVVQPRFSLCFLSAAEMPGLMSVVFCQHLTPELLRRPEWLRHENGIVGVQTVTSVVPNLPVAAETYARLFGDDAIEQSGDRLAIRAGDHHTIELMTPNAARDTWAASDVRLDDPNGRLLSLSLEVAGANHAERCLATSGVEFQRTSSGSIRIPPGETCGVPLEFTERTW